MFSYTCLRSNVSSCILVWEVLVTVVVSVYTTTNEIRSLDVYRASNSSPISYPWTYSLPIDCSNTRVISIYIDLVSTCSVWEGVTITIDDSIIRPCTCTVVVTKIVLSDLDVCSMYSLICSRSPILDQCSIWIILVGLLYNRVCGARLSIMGVWTGLNVILNSYVFTTICWLTICVDVGPT